MAQTFNTRPPSFTDSSSDDSIFSLKGYLSPGNLWNLTLPPK